MHIKYFLFFFYIYSFQKIRKKLRKKSVIVIAVLPLKKKVLKKNSNCTTAQSSGHLWAVQVFVNCMLSLSLKTTNKFFYLVKKFFLQK